MMYNTFKEGGLCNLRNDLYVWLLLLQSFSNEDRLNVHVEHHRMTLTLNTPNINKSLFAGKSNIKMDARDVRCCRD